MAGVGQAVKLNLNMMVSKIIVVNTIRDWLQEYPGGDWWTSLTSSLADPRSISGRVALNLNLLGTNDFDNHGNLRKTRSTRNLLDRIKRHIGYKRIATDSLDIVRNNRIQLAFVWAGQINTGTILRSTFHLFTAM